MPTSRLRRTAKVGGLVGSQAARNAATRTANLGRSKEKRRIAVEKRQVEAAEQIFEVLGSMKGPALKVGQVASFVDTGVLPPEFEDRIQEKLAELRDSAPRVPFEDMRKVIESELEQPLDDVFEEFDEAAIAAASIGQVYRARLREDADRRLGGREVAVKVQYPDVARAVRSDLDNLGLLMRVAKTIAPGMDSQAMSREMRERLVDELDYEHEAQSQRDLRAHLARPPVRRHPRGLDRPIARAGHRAGVRSGPQLRRGPEGGAGGSQPPGRGRLPLLLRLALPDWLLLRRPAPGQLPADGRRPRRVPRLRDDEAATRRPSRPRRRADPRGDGRRRRGRARRDGGLGYFDANDDRIPAERVLEHIRRVSGWYLDDREFTLTSDYTVQVMIDFGDPRSEFWDMMKRQTVPPDSMLLLRMEALVVNVLAQLEATANWHRIVREMLFGDPPATEMGEQEAEFWARARSR